MKKSLKCHIIICQPGKIQNHTLSNYSRLNRSIDVEILFRCPAWCDRILMSKAGKELINGTDNYQYDIIGADTCMGDHKVSFHLNLAIPSLNISKKSFSSPFT